MSPPRKLFDLAAADDSRFSPYCWRIKLALAHKNLPFETVSWRFTDKDKIAFTGQGKVPVLVDGKTSIHDSQDIAEYLESHYSNEPSLFGDAPQKALTRFVKEWAETTLHPAIAKLVLPDIFEKLAPQDQPYFRETREAAFGMTIEAVRAARESYVPGFHAALVPIRNTLKTQNFISGPGPAYADHIIFGALRWGTMMSKTPLLDADDIITVWMKTLLETYGL